MRNHFLAALWCAVGLSPVLSCQANCGQGICTVNTDWEVQGVAADAGTRFDLRQEFIDQDQARAGSRKVALGEVHRHHDEVRTLSRNTLLTVDHQFNERWGVSITAPFSNRDHHHIHHHNGGEILESWSYARLGDARLMGRYQAPTHDAGESRWGLLGGVKLPTGKRDLSNADGDLAERPMQPGTGTTDWIAGAFYQHSFSSVDGFAQIQLQRAITQREHYAPGMRTTLDVGLRYPVTDAIALLAQLNILHRGRDVGDAAEPEDSGGRFIYLSPGVSFSVTRSLRLSAFVQLPIYQYVNGVQLTADWSAIVGITARF